MEYLKNSLKARLFRLTEDLLRYHNQANFKYIPEVHSRMTDLQGRKVATEFKLRELEQLERNRK